MTLRRAILFATVGLVTTGALAAGLDDYVMVTYNTQGTKWGTDISSLMLKDAYQVVAVQEAGPKPDMWGTGKVVNTEKCTDSSGHTETFQVLQYAWNNGKKPAAVFFLNSDTIGHRVNAAFAVDATISPTSATIICPQQDNTKKGTPGRPILGITMPNHAMYFTMHAGSYGNNQYNDADNIVSAVTNLLKDKSTCWAILGDFNREPEQLKNVTKDQRVNTGQPTHMGDTPRELDYMIVRSQQCRGDLLAERLNGKGSDHIPVGFKTKK